MLLSFEKQLKSNTIPFRRPSPSRPVPNRHWYVQLQKI